MELVGRRTEREAVERLLDEARSGRSGALAVVGEAGIGKTALLEHARAVAATTGFRVESSVGIESEVQFAFAGLHQLCAPLLDRVPALPAPQQTALGVAFGQREGTAPDRFLVGLAVLSLLAEVAEPEPLLCLVDDAQWLDETSAQVMAFVARRLAAERVALLFAVREPEGGDTLPFAGLPELHLGGLGERDARALFSTAIPAPIDDRVGDRIVAESRGNPLALLELPRSASLAQLAGGFERPDSIGVPHRLEQSFVGRLSDLPTETQLLLVMASSEPTGDVDLLWRAAEQLGIEREAMPPAEAAGLVELDHRVRFRHPLVRSAVYRAASPPDRRRVHRALAAATDPQVDPDRRAWHRARATQGADEGAAADLVRSAYRARARGGPAAAGVFLQLAAELTPDPADRAARALQAAQIKHEAGDLETARELLTLAATGPLDALDSARLRLLRARTAWHLERGRAVPGMLLEAAEALAALDPALARETYLEAMDAASVNGDHEVIRVATAAQAAPGAATRPRPQDLLLDGLVETLTAGFSTGAPALRLALEAFRDETDADRAPESGANRWLWLAGRTAVGVLDDELAHVLGSRHVREAREAGALAALPTALSFLASVSTLTGELARAGELAEESLALAEAIGAVSLHHGQVMLAAWRGDDAATTRLTDLTLRDPAHPERGGEATVAYYAMAVLNNGSGKYADARVAAARTCEGDELGLQNIGLPELVEAAVRDGDRGLASSAVERFEPRALACGTPWALGLAARCRALTSTGGVAEENYREAVEQLHRSRMRGEAARARLVYGEWLRREGRRQEAREQLRTAHQLLAGMGVEAFAERAARELRATGEHPRRRSAPSTDALTTHELQIARLVATGATSREVAAQLFLSPRTIDAHLRNIFRKLGITSRRQLRELQLS